MISRLIGILFLFYAVVAAAEDPASDNRLTFVFGPYVRHFHDDPNHNDEPWLTGLEWQPSGSWLEYGAVFFRNSFYQPSVYTYVGKRWFAGADEQGLFLNVTGGPLYGYRGQYEDKVPFNQHGLTLAIIPGIGYQYRAATAQLVFLGTAAILLAFGYDFSN
ncbi:MAG TPA: sn-glycerol-3-phosphate transporter [Burkholderiales bacterium]|nr:sn-glycerol-3-phosphate transporter [Burkholderiales bacterium]